MNSKRKMPFEYKNNQEFQSKLVEWVGDVLYDFLPEHDYEVRDEQIFTAFQIADAICGKKVHLAEAGLGTGKTFAYLLSAIPYARFTGKPVVIACATTALQEQLAGATGDVQTLSKLLDLDVDARMAKDPHQYICDVRVNDNIEKLGPRADEIQTWLDQTKLGERSEIPTLTDAEWKKIKWDESMVCDRCANRGFCKLVKARNAYRVTKDLLIVDHETFFHDLWTREDRIVSGQSPILPEYSAVIFDEGHKVLLPAVMQAGQPINKEEIDTMISDLAEIQGARESLVSTVDRIDTISNLFFEKIQKCMQSEEGAERVSICREESLVQTALNLRKLLDDLLLELEVEQELYTDSLSSHQMQAYEKQIERTIWALNQFCKDQGTQVLSWVELKDHTLWIVPRKIKELLHQHLFNKEIPVIFTSATLSHEGDFEYFINTFGLKNPSSSTIGSPFDLENQVSIYLPETSQKIEDLVCLLKENGGRALVLASSLSEVKKIKQALQAYTFPFELIWEDEGERGYLVRKFKEEETSVLIGAHFWEGIDVPGDALTLLIIWDLPLGLNDPLMDMQRKEAETQGQDPLVKIDYPKMGLQLKQGCGRLIRSEEDRGVIVILDDVVGKPWEAYVMGALPSGASVFFKEYPTLNH